MYYKNLMQTIFSDSYINYCHYTHNINLVVLVLLKAKYKKSAQLT